MKEIDKEESFEEIHNKVEELDKEIAEFLLKMKNKHKFKDIELRYTSRYGFSFICKLPK